MANGDFDARLFGQDGRTTERREPGARARRKIGHGVLLAVTALSVAGCARARASSDSTADSTFVATIVELRKVAANGSLDSAAKVTERGRVLQSRGLSQASLEARSRALAASPARAAAVWEAIGRSTNGIVERH